MPSNSQEYLKKYREENGATIRRKQCEKVCCDICNKHVSRSGIAAHRKSIKHQFKVLLNAQKNSTGI